VLLGHLCCRARCFTSNQGKGNIYLCGVFFSPQWSWEQNSPFVGQAVVPSSQPTLVPSLGGTAGGGGCCAQGGEQGRGVPVSWCRSCESYLGFQELEAIKARVREMEKEDERLKELQLEAESRLIMSLEAGRGCAWVLLCPRPPPAPGHLWGVVMGARARGPASPGSPALDTYGG